MKALFTMITVLTAFGTTSAFANYNSDSLDGPVSCKGKTANLLVTIGGARAAYTVTLNGHQLPMTKVTGHNSDGDTFISYIADDENSLSFDDQGDSLELNGKTFALKCQSGN